VQGAGNAPTVGDIPQAAGKGFVMGGLLGAPFGAAADLTPRSAAVVPTQKELFDLGAKDYNARDTAPVSYDLNHVEGRLRGQQQTTRNDYGRDAPYTSQKLVSLADEARTDINAAQALNPNPPNAVAGRGQTGAPNSWQPVATPRDIASLRNEIYEAGANGKPTDEKAAVEASRSIHDIMANPDPASLVSGSPRDAAAVAMLDARGRGNFSAAYRDKAVTDQIENSTFTAGGQHSGLNFENILRQNLNRARKAADFDTLNPDEETALEKLITGTTKANSIREFGNMLGGGGGLGRMVAMGGGGLGTGAIGAWLTGNDPVMGAGAGLALGLTGRALRTYGNAQAQKSAEEFSELIRKRSPEYTAREAAAPFVYGPGLDKSPVASGLSKSLTIGGDGGVRDSVARAIVANSPRRIPIDTTDWK
jgi:hypothetical protein